AVAFTLLVAPHYAWYFAWLVPFLCFYPVVGVIYLTCAVSLLYFAHWPPTVSQALPIYVPCILILMTEFALRRRRKAKEPHADAVVAGGQGRPPALFRGRRRAAQRARGAAAGLRLSRDHEPLQPLVHDLSPHLRAARAARRHELGALHLDRRPDSKPAT